MYLTVSTGIGGGVVSDGQLILGQGGLGGEVGHMTVEASGPRCNCGNVGCLEALASGMAIARQARDLVTAGARTCIADLVNGDLERVEAKVIHEAARQGDVVAVDLFRKAGMYLAIGIVNLWSNTTLLDDVGSVGYVVGTGIDVAERKETEEALYTLSRAVEQSPSTVVITGTEGRIEYANPKFTEIAESLLLAGVRKVDAEMMRLDMASVVVGAQQRLTDMIEEHRAEITLPDAWPVAWGYPPWIEEVWVNYLSNAVRYGGRPPRVELGAKVQPDGMMRFWVRDNGSGLTREEQTRLFTPFTQLDQTRAEGHGPGLSIVRPIVEKLGGQVGVGSEGVPGRGGVFTFTLPSTGAEA